MGGNTLIQQRRGKGKSPVYVIPSHLSAGEIRIRSQRISEFTKTIRGKVIELLKDSIHHSPLMKIKYEDGVESLLPAVEGVYIGKEVYIGPEAPIEPGNILPLKYIPEGTKINTVEIIPGDGGKLIRSSGTFGILVQKTDTFAIIKLPSRRLKRVHILSRAVVGVVAGGGRTDKPFVKAGNKYYWMKAHHKYWPVVSAVAKNAADHPFGSKHKRNKGGITPLPKKGYPIKYGYYGSRRTGRKKSS